MTLTTFHVVSCSFVDRLVRSITVQLICCDPTSDGQLEVHSNRALLSKDLPKKGELKLPTGVSLAVPACAGAPLLLLRNLAVLREQGCSAGRHPDISGASHKRDRD
jgi:hypothetical protein